MGKGDPGRENVPNSVSCLGEWWGIHVVGVHGGCVVGDEVGKVSRGKS